MELKNTDNFSSWTKWKKTLSNAINISEAAGMSEKTVEKIGYRIGNILNAAVDPENREQRVLQELWKSADNEDRHALTRMIINMVKTDDN